MNETIEKILSTITFEGREQVSDGFFRKERLIKMLTKSYLAGAAAKEAEVREKINNMVKEHGEGMVQYAVEYHVGYNEALMEIINLEALNKI